MGCPPRPLVLVADGFAPVRRRMAAALTVQGFEVVEAVSMIDALRVMTSRGVPEGFVVDGHLAHGQGLRFAHSLGTLEKTRACPVVLLVNDAAALERLEEQPLHEAVEPLLRSPLLEKLVGDVVARLRGRPGLVPDGPLDSAAIPAEHADEIRALEDAFRIFERVVGMVRDGTLPGPVIPELLRDVMTLLADPDVSFAQLAHFIGRHQAIAARLLAGANSVFYLRSNARVTSLQVAISRVGQREASRILQSVAARAYVVGKDAALRKLITDNLDLAYVVALAADTLARLGRPPHEGDVYTAGLFHNIGPTFLYYALALLKDKGKIGGVDVEALQTLAASRAAELNQLMCEQMRLPWEIVAIYASSQRPDVSEATIALIHQAMWVGDRLLGTRDASGLVLDAEGEILGLSPEALHRIREAAPRILALLDACRG